MNRKRLSGIIISAAAIIIAAVIIFDAVKKEPEYEASAVAMGSVVTLKLCGKNSQDIAEEIISDALNTENSFISRYKPTSEIYRLNESKELELSDFTSNVIKRAVEISTDSNDAFNITLGKLSSLWDFDGDKQAIPDGQSIKNALFHAETQYISFSGNYFTIDKNLCLDLGAVGKGLACDNAKKILDLSDITDAVVSVGGSVLVYDKNNEKTKTVGIKTPETNNDAVAIKIKISGTKFISTSGNYEKCFTENGRLYHHILSSETGYPVESGLKSVTVISDSGLDSDALSTACFVLGTEKSKQLLQKYDARAVFITENNDVYISEEIFKQCEAISDEYTFYKL